MTTYGELIAGIHTSLHSFTGVQEQLTWLTSSIDADDLTIPVSNSEMALRGVVEVDEELLYVDSTDSTGLVVAPFGRGYKSSTATSHALNAQVTFDPTFPKVEIKRVIGSVVQALYPTLFRVQSATLTYSSTVVGYELPADCGGVLEVKAKRDSDHENQWVPLSGWSFDSTSPEATGKVLNLFDPLAPGMDLEVSYFAPFADFASDSDTMASVGLSESHVDLIVYGATARLVRFLDPGRLQVGAVENLSRAAVVSSGDAGRVANQLYAMYSQRLAEERRRLLDLYPARSHFNGR